MRLFQISHLLWFLIFCQIVGTSFAFFFPMFGNFFSRFRNNNNGNQGHALPGQGNPGNGGVSIFSTAASANTGSGNLTSIRVPMLSTSPQRRVDVVTTVVSTAPAGSSNSNISTEEPSSSNETFSADLSSSSSDLKLVQVTNNVNASRNDNSSIESSPASSQSAAATVTVETRRSDQGLSTSQKFVIPTSTSVTSSISAIQHGVPVLQNQGLLGTPNALTLPFTPNLFGMMSYVQALKDIKMNYHHSEAERKLAFHQKDGDLMTRVLRTLIHKVVNKYQKGTEMIKLKILKRQAKLQKFLQLPMVAQVVAMDPTRVGLVPPIATGNDGAGIVVPVPAAAVARQGLPFFSEKPATSILNSFLIR